jgi:hypothetical protein
MNDCNSDIVVAFEQLQRLCSMGQTWMFEQIADTVEHHYNLLINTNWKQQC